MIDFKNIDTVIFDMDGVLIDYEPLWKAAEIKVFETIGIDFIKVGGEKTVGLRIDEVIDYWYEKYPWENKTKAQVVDEIMLEMVNGDRKSTRLNSSHVRISYAVFCLKKNSMPSSA